MRTNDTTEEEAVRADLRKITRDLIRVREAAQAAGVEGHEREADLIAGIANSIYLDAVDGPPKPWLTTGADLPPGADLEPIRLDDDHAERKAEEHGRRLLDRYGDKPFRKFLQIDYWTGETIGPADADGDCPMAGQTSEPMRSPGKNLPVRILIHEDADRADVLRTIRKAADYIERELDWLREEFAAPREPLF